MSDADQVRWDARYQSAAIDWSAAPIVVSYVSPALPGAKALDVACGAGRHALYLASLGYQVTAVDVSLVALDLLLAEADRRGLTDKIHLLHADLDVWRPPSASYELVVQIAFFDRTLLRYVAEAVRPEGRLILEVFNARRAETQPGFNRAFTAQPGELAAACQGWSILYGDDDAGDQRDRAQLVAERIKL